MRNNMKPLLLGGGMNARFDSDGNIILKDAPNRLEAGTPNIADVIAFLSKTLFNKKTFN